MPINGKTLAHLREQRNLSQARLAEHSGIDRKTISRIENEEVQQPNTNTAEKLAKALGVSANDLAKEVSDDSIREKTLRDGGYRKLSAYIDAKTALSYSMIHHIYNVQPRYLVDIAPLLFTIIAEGSLVWRREKLGELKEAIGRLETAASGVPHLSFAGAGAGLAEDGIEEEQESIDRRDVFGLKISDRALECGFDPETDNPFVDYLRDLTRRLPKGSVDIDEDLSYLGEGLPRYRIAPEEFAKITNNDYWAQFAIERGYARISKIPEDLTADDRAEERVMWLASKIPDEVRRKEQAMLDDLKLDLGELPTAALEQ